MFPYFNKIKNYVDTTYFDDSINDSDNEITIKTDDDIISIDGETRDISNNENIFNSNILSNSNNNKSIIIVKDVIDALCLLTNGYMAMSIKNISAKVIQNIVDENKNAIFDKLYNTWIFDYSLLSTKERTDLKKMGKILLDNNIKFFVFDLTTEKYKHINDFIGTDETGFLKYLNNIDHKISNNFVEGIKEIKKKRITNSFDNFYIDLYLSELRQAEPYIPTGFSYLDELLGGGFYEGLYTIGAISSLGKTTFMLQIADYIANQGQCVLFFSLEMSRMELMLKTLSRHTYLIVTENNNESTLNSTKRTDNYSLSNAMTTNKIRQFIRNGKEYPNDFEVFSKAVDKYKEYASNKRIVERTRKIGIREVKEEIENTIKTTGKTPIVIIDYLQALAPENDRNTEKQNVDIAMTELKAISRDYRTNVFVISSLNRSNYKVPISFEAFKESGSIEYASDVVLGLQYNGVGENDFDFLEASRKEIREIELVLLKNRNGVIAKSVIFDYYAMFNHYRDTKIIDRFGKTEVKVKRNKKSNTP